MRDGLRYIEEEYIQVAEVAGEVPVKEKKSRNIQIVAEWKIGQPG